MFELLNAEHVQSYANQLYIMIYLIIIQTQKYVFFNNSKQ